MPNLDGKGPRGKGPQTGGRRGRCLNDQTSQVKEQVNKSVENDEGRYGMGARRRGRGFGGEGGNGIRDRRRGKGRSN